MVSDEEDTTKSHYSDILPLPEVIEKTPEEIREILEKQNSRRVSSFEATKLEKEAKKNWDIFYKRNESRFFKDRHWTLREFQEILDWQETNENKFPRLLEVGCGCGNFAIPLLDEIPTLLVYACDFSPRAIDLVKSHEKYDDNRIKAFTADITQEDCFKVLCSPDFQFKDNSNEVEIAAVQNNLLQIDFVSMVFVLSAISPSKHSQVIQNIASVMKPGGIVFFRDYGRHDMAQLRFKGGNKITDNFYVRRDGTRAYYFELDEVETLFTEGGHFKKINCEFIHRRTVNIKQNVNVSRIFVQSKFIKV